MHCQDSYCAAATWWAKHTGAYPQLCSDAPPVGIPALNAATVECGVSTVTVFEGLAIGAA